jgi:hypothetical protein
VDSTVHKTIKARYKHFWEKVSVLPLEVHENCETLSFTQDTINGSSELDMLQNIAASQVDRRRDTMFL